MHFMPNKLTVRAMVFTIVKILFANFLHVSNEFWLIPPYFTAIYFAPTNSQSSDTEFEFSIDPTTFNFNFNLELIPQSVKCRAYYHRNSVRLNFYLLFNVINLMPQSIWRINIWRNGLEVSKVNMNLSVCLNNVYNRFELSKRKCASPDKNIEIIF